MRRASTGGHHVHLPTALLSLDVFVDILDIRYHRVLSWRELVVL